MNKATPNRKHFRQIAVAVMIVALIPLNQANCKTSMVDRYDEVPVLVQHVSTTNEEFENALSKHPDMQTYTQYSQAHRLHPKIASEIEAKLEMGQRALWANDSAQAKQIFESISSDRFSQDWTDSLRETIFYSLVMTAKLSLVSSRRDQLLREAIAFAGDIKLQDHWLNKAEKELFQKHKTQLEAAQLKLELNSIARNYEIVMLNGRVFETKDAGAISVPPGTHRITLVSNKYQTQSFILDSQQLVQTRPINVSLVQSSCETASEALLDLETKAYLVEGEKFCELTTHISPKTKHDQQNSQNSRDLGSGKDEIDTRFQVATQSLTDSNNKKVPTWLWVIGGAAVSFFLISQFAQAQQSGSGGYPPPPASTSNPPSTPTSTTQGTSSPPVVVYD
ncbi:MAG: hypothetical protein COT74_07275 [Bdellovibrionales bacterium CG10_big_fil_rev_8_21_14_0_10_45_34]|nr:MAG: hypothetical protein COT74_07275 [Bdellovibrionales bacterium CG10_big_fil_rev_8_21_14_0_10_45_34]